MGYSALSLTTTHGLAGNLFQLQLEVPLEWNVCWCSISYPPPVGELPLPFRKKAIVGLGFQSRILSTSWDFLHQWQKESVIAKYALTARGSIQSIFPGNAYSRINRFPPLRTGKRHS